MNDREDATAHHCADCGEEGGGAVVSLKTCMSCMLAKYCNATCQRNHWAKHKKECKLRAAELRDKALFKDPPAKEDCPICFLPMPTLLLCCLSLPDATISLVPIYDFANANEELAATSMEEYYPCCGKSICAGCVYSLCDSGNIGKCPFCNCDRSSKTDEEEVEDTMKRVEANDPGAMCRLANCYYDGLGGIQQDQTKGKELYARAAGLGCSDAHYNLGTHYRQGGDLKKASFHYEAAAMAGHEVARCNLGRIEYNSGNMERAIKHLTIAASAGNYAAMHLLRFCCEGGFISRETIDSTLAEYNNSCAEMRSEARDSYIRFKTETM
jgi:tetratricopeptide (TPR) repeat protein